MRMWGQVMRAVLVALLWLVAASGALAQDDAPPPASDGTKRVVVGGYINDIHHVDLTTHSYPGDIYIWFRWDDPEDAPHETFEFMNLYDPEAHIESFGYDAPQVMERGGQRYNYIRHQGAFSSAMNLTKYPFDDHVLRFIIEDAEYGTEVLNYVPDPEGLTINSQISLPGYRIGAPRMVIEDNAYPTTFGDLNNPDTGAYSRVVFEVPIARPWQFGVFKLFLPVLIVLMCSALALYIDPTHTEGRIGLVITALLTLVAMQITTAGTLPDVGYLTLLDMVYLVSYAYILLIMARVARGSWIDGKDEMIKAARGDRRLLLVATLGYVALVALVTLIWLSRELPDVH